MLAIPSSMALRVSGLFLILVGTSIRQINAENISSTTISASSCTVNGPSVYLGSPDIRVHGWVGQPNGRGTIDIIWTSLATIFISTYVMLCLNVPSTGEPWWIVAYRRILWMGISIAGPEFVLTAAAGQWAAAKRSVGAFKSAGYGAWTMSVGKYLGTAVTCYETNH